MRQQKKYLIYLILFSAVFSGCFKLFEPGTNTVIKRVYNPAKNQEAVLFIKGGNATSGNSLQVSIRNMDDEFSDTEVGNIFTTDSNHTPIILDSTAVGLVRLTNNRLLIRYNSKLRTFTQVNILNGDSIKYQQF